MLQPKEAEIVVRQKPVDIMIVCPYCEHENVASGVIRRVDDLGRIVLPREVRNLLGISDGTPMEICVSNGRVILKRYCAEDALSSMVRIFAESLEERSEDLEKGKAEDIKQHVREIQKLLKKN